MPFLTDGSGDIHVTLKAVLFAAAVTRELTEPGPVWRNRKTNKFQGRKES